MNLQGFEKIAINADILIYIYKFLSFKDQLILSCVSGQLYDCFVNFIAKEPYRALNIFRRLSDIAITNGINANSVILKQYELRDFLQVYAGNVYQLCENFPTPLIYLEKFRNLTSYSLENKQMPHEHLELISRCCPNLQNLEMFEAVYGVHLIVNILMSMGSLKRLTLKYSDFDHHLEYRYFLDFVCRLNLEALTVQATLVPSVLYSRTNSTQNQLKELTFRTSFDPDVWLDSFRSYLANLENLTSLTFAAPDGVDDMSLRVISQTCKKLKVLTIQHTPFAVIKPIYTPAEVTEFALEHCTGLSWENFKEILSQHSISKFTSIGTSYMGDFEDFQISPYIEELHLEGSIYMHRFKSAYKGNTTLKELKWCEDEDCLYDAGHVINVPMETCPNLETLILKAGFVPLGSLMQLMYLNKLQITIQDTTPLISWSYITALLKHPSLTELTIDSLCDDDECLQGTSVPPVEGFATKIKHLSLACDVFKQELHFWLDLFRRNLHMHFVCQKFYTNNPALLEAVIYHEKFPRNQSVIDIWGFTIRCEDLRNNFQTLTGKLVEHRMKLHPDVVDINRIIMRRGQ